MTAKRYSYCAATPWLLPEQTFVSLYGGCNHGNLALSATFADGGGTMPISAFPNEEKREVERKHIDLHKKINENVSS